MILFKIPKIGYHVYDWQTLMKNKKVGSDSIDNLEYEKVLEEEIINSYESKFLKDNQPDKKKTKFYRLKRSPLEIVNRTFFLFFIGSFLFSLFLAYSESKLWFILYVTSALSCVFYLSLIHI